MAFLDSPIHSLHTWQHEQRNRPSFFLCAHLLSADSPHIFLQSFSSFTGAKLQTAALCTQFTRESIGGEEEKEEREGKMWSEMNKTKNENEIVSRHFFISFTSSTAPLSMRNGSINSHSIILEWQAAGSRAGRQTTTKKEWMDVRRNGWTIEFNSRTRDAVYIGASNVALIK